MEDHRGFEQHINNEEDFEVVQSKVILMGNPAAGKTSLVERIAKNAFINNRPSTMGTVRNVTCYDFNEKTRNEKQQLELNWWDIGGQVGNERGQMFNLTGASVALLCVNVQDTNWKADNEERLNKYRKFLLNVPIFLVVTKADELKRSEQQNADIIEFAQKNNLQKIFYTSALQEKDVEVKALENSVVFACLDQMKIKQDNYKEDKEHNTPPKAQQAKGQQSKEEIKLEEEIKVVSLDNKEQKKSAKPKIGEPILEQTAQNLFKARPIKRETLISEIKKLQKTYDMDVIDKLKLLELIFENIKTEVEQKPQPDEKQFWFKGRNLQYTKADLDSIDALKKLYVNYIASEPWNGWVGNEIKKNPLNEKIQTHVITEKANALINFQQTQYKFLETKTTSTRQQIDLLKEGAGRENVSPAVIKLKYHR